jgi:2-oxoacid:acceptor oxidoreductase delta subunit (pyruvate/2-ketoisovalerate family)
MKPKINPGAIIDTPGNIRGSKKVSFRNLKPVTDFSKCIKCGKCWMFCPDSAFEPKEDGTFENIERFCKGCGICANVCPAKCIKMEVVEQ